ncbi:cytochrome c [Alteromonas sp. C1M14]|uniref:c-type cytochrome n=1 Tax=Alteromonas sp. C1M14 TaxID=2841567 RepID=UPI001C0865F9|nr:cytochrome c [Alteromonas sp. C1M14]MBU2980009.1 cytochrome c [Alteromonas sp. C1M14]
MYKKVIAVAGLVLFSTTSSAAGSVEAGKAKSAVCASCHGAQGISIGPLWPNLAGQKKEYLIKQLNDFKTQKRSDPMMSAMALPLSEQDMADLAAYYSSL